MYMYIQREVICAHDVLIIFSSQKIQFKQVGEREV